MVTSQNCLNKYGDPNLITTQQKHFELWIVEQDILIAFTHVKFSALGTIGFPKKIFLNKDMKEPLRNALRTIICRGLTKELKTWDGVFIIRTKRNLSLNVFKNTCRILICFNPLFINSFRNCNTIIKENSNKISIF